MTASVLELTHCEWITGSNVIQAVTEFSWNCVTDSDISPYCFLYEIQKDRFRK